ncbi:MAG TPA: rhodanese-like domain-containing protein [Phycisphaerales bacterium]|jgi:rhodanese-related sulfurtransferase|nr:rhodanese-like domain-containing protein [Phycisphaerales bacterium]HIB51422.1 rhodanese-like domain-containing protein [Phycisphaerales bacterium]HIN83279.1 rhodanese-like domain-containing protein [Phycisphaerales bacterium]HIO20752.1 rhodanese-like domain-containing protein [Phycisphaerales bacterium]HIO52269.1 rhodanese-like domain-containing protein [Phycisphaerales bacterium]
MVISLKSFATLYLLYLLLLAGCNAGISDKNVSFISPEDAAISIRDGRSNLLGPNLQTMLIDPRATWAFRKAHIPNSINIPYGRLNSQVWRLDDAGTIIVCGATYNDSIAIAMSKTLLSLGFKDVKTIRGGLKGWERAGELVETLE